MSSEADDNMICVGSLSGSYGVRGEVRLKSYCAEPSDIADYNPLRDAQGKQLFSVTLVRPLKGGYAARVSGVTTKEEADALRGTDLFAHRDQLPSLPDDEFYHADLIGLDVLDAGGAALGKVKSVQNHGAGDLLEVFGPGLKNTVLLPFTREAVPTVDLAGGRIIVDPPEGLF